MSSVDRADLFLYIQSLKNVDLHFRYDPETQMKAIIAVASTGRGPALGGCRCIHYDTTSHAIRDVVKLAHGMTYKSALADLPHAGGKAVIIKPQQFIDRAKTFQAFGRFVDELGGQYITAMDSGTTFDDMISISKNTLYVAAQVRQGDSDDDPSPFTAMGIRRGIEAAVHHQLKRDSLDGCHIAIQGVGKVGYYLAKEVHEIGAKLTVADVNPELTTRCADEFGASIETSEQILRTKCDVLAPCALGGIINEQSINNLQTTIIAGGANNQLSNPTHAQTLHERGVLYAPDYAINAGGLIHCVAVYSQTTNQNFYKKVDNIYNTLTEIFQRSDAENKSTLEVADIIAEERL